jgi:hypothetical protein
MKIKIVFIGVILTCVFVFFIAKDKGNYIHTANKSELYTNSKEEIRKWLINDSLYQKEDVEQAKLFSKHEMKISIEDSSIQKVSKIGSYLIEHLHSKLGNPDSAMFKRTPWEQFYFIKNSSAEFYCTQYSAMFAFFCRVNGLATREIECKGKNDLHIFNETYLPETKQWVYTDLTQGIISLQKQNRLMHLIEVYEVLYGQSQWPMLQCNVNDCSTMKQVGFESFVEQLKYNFDSQCVFYFYQNADLSIQPSPLFKQTKPCALVYSNNIVYFKWPFIRWVSIVLGLVMIYKLIKLF